MKYYIFNLTPEHPNIQPLITCHILLELSNKCIGIDLGGIKFNLS